MQKLKLLTLFFSFLKPLTYTKQNNLEPLIINQRVHKDQIIQGSFMLQDSSDVIVSVTIHHDVDDIYFHKEKIKNNAEINFSFSVVEDQNLEIRVTYENAPSVQPTRKNRHSKNMNVGKISLKIDASFDYFNEKMETENFKKPLEKLLLKYFNIIKASLEKAKALEANISESMIRFKSVFTFMFVLSLAMFIGFTGILILQGKKAKDYFRKKKYI